MSAAPAPAARAAKAALQQLLRELRPLRQPGAQVFATWPAGGAPAPAHCVATMREAEGLSVILAAADARRSARTGEPRWPFARS